MDNPRTTAPTQGRAARRSLRAVVVLVVIAAAVLLLGRREERARSSVHELDFHEQQVARAKRRATWAPPVSEPAPAAPEKRDPFMVALPIKPETPVVMFEVNALRYSKLGEGFLGCVQARDGNRFADLARQTGIDPLRDIDRVAFMGDSIVVSGQFESAHWDRLGPSPERYGQSGRIYQTPQMAVGTWGPGLLVLSPHPERVQTAMDQLEGRAPAPEPPLAGDQMLSEIYGIVPGAAARAALGSGSGDGGLLDRIASLASRIELSADAMEDLAADVHIRGNDSPGLSALGDELGAALTAARANARAGGNKKLSTLLENVKVKSSDREISIHVAVPASRVEDLLGNCDIFGPPAGAISTASR
jgi:hypothetical protein